MLHFISTLWSISPLVLIPLLIITRSKKKKLEGFIHQLLAEKRITVTEFTNKLTEKAQKGSFTYIIDDVTTYHELGDFRSSDAANLFQRWTDLKHQYETDLAKLEKQRDDYANASRQEKERMSQQLLEFEDRVLKAEQQITKMENDIRTTEINYLNR